ncbi:MAG: HAMP domain-containing sensor histidine kinase [Verrucomicrobiota bacterium]
MRLSEFILVEMEEILVEWEAFAKSLYPVKSHMTALSLRDHAKEILQAIAADLRTEQTEERRSQKSKGQVQPLVDAPETAAQTHALLRAQSGMDINQLCSEYRALRASVLRLWSERVPLSAENIEDVIRFNEAIDQALAESVSFFSEQVTQSRNLLLGMLGHDMRSPLNAITLTAEHLADLNAGEEISEAAQCLIDSGASMKALLDDLVDFSRRKLGLGICIEAGPTDLGALCTTELRQHRAAQPNARIELKLEGNLHGQWDGPRLQQVLRNLLTNACAYGTAGKLVQVAAYGGDNEVTLEVRNTGPSIDSANSHQIFEPLRRGSPAEHSANGKGLGLGLYIVREITHAHGGKVELLSEGEETIFSVRLPRVFNETQAGSRK